MDKSIRLVTIESGGTADVYNSGRAAMEHVAMAGFAVVLAAVVYGLSGMVFRRVASGK